LDVDTEGLLLFTDDGKLLEGLINDRKDEEANAGLKHGQKMNGRKRGKGALPPREKVAKVYLVEVRIMPWQRRVARALETARVPAGVRGRAAAWAGGEGASATEMAEAEVQEGRMRAEEAECVRRGALTDGFLESLRSPLEYPDGAITRPAEVEECTSETFKGMQSGALSFLVQEGGCRDSAARTPETDTGRGSAGREADQAAVGRTAKTDDDERDWFAEIAAGIPGEEAPAKRRKVDGDMKSVRKEAAHSATPSSARAGRSVPTGDATFWVRVKITQGKNRQVRRLCHRAGLDVLRLVRVAVGPLTLAGKESASAATALTKAGAARSLTRDELVACYRMARPGANVPEILPLDAVMRRRKR
jgi:16S rRNA U516 pseudouridylate synthase RsuA-like enzyme